jgi:hypothetical protein
MVKVIPGMGNSGLIRINTGKGQAFELPRTKAQTMVYVLMDVIQKDRNLACVTAGDGAGEKI